MGKLSHASAQSVSSRSDARQPTVRDKLACTSDTLTRMIGGEIVNWSLGMQQRYGFDSEDAIGRKSHELLQTVCLNPEQEIEAALANKCTWSGWLIHRCANGRAVIAANCWQFHREVDGRGASVTETHSDILPGGVAGGIQLADMIAKIAHELSEPLTAISNYIRASEHGLRSGWPDLARQRQAMSLAADEVARGVDALHLLRQVASAISHAE